MIPEQVIEQIASANDVVDVIGGYFPLKRAGAVYKALCPFHREKSPSFTVNPARQTFKCFGCGAGGSVFKFVELYENINFPEAAKRLAARAGIRIVDEPLTPEEDIRHRMRRRLLGLHAEAAEWFHLNLLRTKAAQPARDYLKGRGITGEVAKSWKLGYAPDSWDALCRWAHEKGYHDGELIASGLVTIHKDDEDSPNPRFYDRFRDRLMIPIGNDLKEVIAFCGRVLDSEKAFGGKYVNSPETALFTKGKTLFGIHKTKRAIIDKGSAIVCEGQIDLITAYEAGIQNVTASQGTAFTEAQAAILNRLTSSGEVILCFDSDAAGLKAAEKSLPVLLEAGLSVRVVEMPPGHDPDSFIREEGADAFRNLLAASRDIFEFQIERFALTPEFATPRGKTAFARKMAEAVSHVVDPVLRQAIVNSVSARLEMQAAQFASLLRSGGKPAWKRESSSGEQEEPGPEPLPPMSNAARLLGQLLLLSGEARQWLLEQPWRPLLASLPEGELLRQLFEGRFEAGEAASIAAFLTSLGPAQQSAAADLLEVRQLPPNPVQVARECWRDLVRRDLERQRDVLTARLRKPEMPLEEVIKLQKQVLDLTQQLTHITRPLSPPP